jgi:hypothetical protein
MAKKIIRLTESDLHRIVKESVQKILVEEYIINEGVDEGIGNWIKGATLGGMMALSSPMQGNAQTQNYNPQQNDTVQVDNTSNFSKETNRELANRIARNMKSAGMSDKDINTEINSMSNFNVAWRNSRGEQNTQIKKYLSSINPTHSTENIHVSRGSGNSELNQLFNGMNKSTAMKYKAFILPDEVYVVMPVNYTLQDVQAELGL